MRIKTVWSLLACTVLLFCAANVAAKSEAADNGFYTAKDKEFYLAPELLVYIIPGFEITIMDVVIPADMQPEVTYRISDPTGLGLDHDGIYTPGVVDMRFTLANIPAGQEQKTRLAYERIDRNGKLTSLGDGVYKYKFDTVVDSDQDTTHTVVAGGRRDLGEFELDTYSANDVYNFVPSGISAPVPRDVVTTETCNRCHDPLAMHGDRWLSPAACTQCHNPTGNTRFDALIHAVHSAGEAGGHDFSEIVYPAPINECGTCHTGGIPTKSFPLVAEPNPVRVCDQSGFGATELSWGDVGDFEIHVGAADGPLFTWGEGAGSAMTDKWVGDGTVFVLVDKASGETLQTLPVNATVLGCVGNAPGTYRGEPGAQWTNWLDHPSRAVCGSCHEHSDIDFENGVGHFVMTDDHLCSVCHQPTFEPEFSWTSVGGVHLSTYKSSQFPGALFEFVDVTNTGPGQKPTVRFKLGSKTGILDPNTVNRLRLNISGPNTDFEYYNQETVSGAVLDGDVWSYTFKTPLPADAEGSYSVGVEGRVTANVDGSNQNETIEASMLPFAVTGSVMPRRTVVEDYNCESCHVDLVLHGGNRTNANYCVTCHMPLATDEAQVRPGNPEQTIHFKYMIHSIHRGAELENGFVVAGFGQSIHDYSDVEYPGDLRNCGTCHVNDSYQLTGLPDDLLPTLTPQAWWSPTQPQAAACLSCHDGDSTAVHAYTNSSFFGESCVTCHGEGKEYSVDKVHAR
jgi:hypothetical protein